MANSFEQQSVVNREPRLRIARYRSPSLGDALPEGPMGLALCGGGIAGAFFEVGVLAALDEIAGGPVSNGFDVYVGASAGASVGALIAQGVRPARLFQALHDESDDFFPLRREDVYQVQLGRWLKVALRIAAIAVVDPVARVFRRGSTEPAKRAELADALPAGLFRLDRYREFLADFLRRAKLSSRLDELERELYIVANDVDSGARVIFGEPPHEHVPIPLAVAASSAIPMFFEPVRIGERDYFDGGIGRVGHVDVLVRRGVRRVLVINPVVPIHNDPAAGLCIPSRNTQHCARIAEKGLLAVGNQAYRIMNKVRLHLGLKRLVAETPDLDIVTVEPGESESVLFLHGSMSMVGRRIILDYARSGARTAFREHLQELAPVLSAFRERVGFSSSASSQG